MMPHPRNVTSRHVSAPRPLRSRPPVEPASTVRRFARALPDQSPARSKRSLTIRQAGGRATGSPVRCRRRRRAHSAGPGRAGGRQRRGRRRGRPGGAAARPVAGSARKPVSESPAACAPTGSEQPDAELGEERPLDLDRRPRRRVVDRGEQRRRRRRRRSRHSTATQPWPGAGTNTVGSSTSAIRSVRPRISSAATAITIAPPSGSLPSRVWMLPRSSTKPRSGRSDRQLARGGAPSPWRPSPPCGSSSSVSADQRVGRRRAGP